MAGGHGIGAAADHQLRQEADAQALGHHGQDGAVLAGGVFHIGVNAHGVQSGGKLIVAALLQTDEGLGGQGRQGEGRRVRQRVAAGNDHQQLIPVQGVGAEGFC